MTKRATPEDLLQMPDNNGLELVDGVLLEKPVSRNSSKIGMRIGYLLSNIADSVDRVDVYGSDLGYRCFREDRNKIRKPDVSVVRKERMADAVGDVGFMPIPPDLAVEVVPPNDLMSAISKKVRQYLDNGFPLIWVVDPIGRTCAIYTPDAPGRILRESDTIEVGPLLPSFKCKVADFFVGIPVDMTDAPDDD